MSFRTFALALAFAPTFLAACDDSDMTAQTSDLSSEERRAPFATKSLYVDPTSNYSAQAALWRNSRSWDADVMDAMAAQPLSIWVGDWTSDVTGTVDSAVSEAGTKLRSFVVYNIPHRDCGAWSAGGADDANQYRSFIADFADGLNGRKALVILEPDALALEDCLTAAQVTEREDLIGEAVTTLTAAGASVYIDAGDSAWIPADQMADKLQSANVAGAAGFALNVSHTETTADSIGFANELRTILGGRAHFVVDTGRNGNGPDATHEWCNPLGRATGDLPTLRTGTTPGLDAKLWIKAPGESDGSCNGGPIAGAFWADYALELGTLGGM